MKKYLVLLMFPFLLGAKMEELNNTPCYKADIIFIIDYSGSMSGTIPDYEPWLRATAGELPLSNQLKAGLLFFSDDVCPSYCPITEDKILLDQKIVEGRTCPSCGTFLESSLVFAQRMFETSTRERGEKVPKILVIVTDLDVSDPVESCEFVYSHMTDTFVILMELEPVEEYHRIKDLKDCLMYNGIYFNGFVWVYEDLLKEFDPCM